MHRLTFVPKLSFPARGRGNVQRGPGRRPQPDGTPAAPGLFRPWGGGNKRQRARETHSQSRGHSGFKSLS